MDEIKAWFSDEQALNEMQSSGQLKQWEAEAAAAFPAGASILNIGCGTGREAFALHAMGFCVTGVDISETAIEAARNTAATKQYNIDFSLTDGKLLSFDHSMFDVVIVWAQTFGLFQGKEEQQQFLAECGRVLKSGGLISFSGHDREYQQIHCADCLAGNRFYPFAGSDIYYESFTIDELRNAAQQAGFYVSLCQRGEVYNQADGTVLHCLCSKG